MTVIDIEINGQALSELLQPLAKPIIFIIAFLFILYVSFMLLGFITSSQKRNRTKKATEIYNKRENEMKDNPECWRRWMKNNNHICKLARYY